MKVYTLLALILLNFYISYVNCDISKLSLEKVTFKNKEGITVPGYLSTPEFTTKTPGSIPAVVILHGCSGVFSWSDPTKGIASLYKDWSKKLTDLNYIVILVDSFSARNAEQKQCGNGEKGTSEVSERPFDVIAAYDYFTTDAKLEGLVNKQAVGLMGWSHGGSTTLTTMSTVNSKGEINPQNFKVAISFYPGCGLYNAFGGISKSTWVPYADTYILHAKLDSLFLSGNCDIRINNAKAINKNIRLEMIVYDGAQHSFDNAKKVEGKWTAADIKAKEEADKFVLEKFMYYLKESKATFFPTPSKVLVIVLLIITLI